MTRNQVSRLPLPPNRPTPIVPPTLHWVVEMGIPMKDATTTTVAADSSIEKPREGLTLVILYPREMISLYP